MIKVNHGSVYLEIPQSWDEAPYLRTQAFQALSKQTFETEWDKLAAYVSTLSGQSLEWAESLTPIELNGIAELYLPLFKQPLKPEPDSGFTHDGVTYTFYLKKVYQYSGIETAMKRNDRIGAMSHCFLNLQSNKPHAENVKASRAALEAQSVQKVENLFFFFTESHRKSVAGFSIFESDANHQDRGGHPSRRRLGERYGLRALVYDLAESVGVLPRVIFDSSAAEIFDFASYRLDESRVRKLESKQK